MDIKQQTKNVAAQGRYGDSMLLHVNPAEVKGLASAMPITVNPETGQPEAFLPFLAPIAGSLLGGSLLGGAFGSTLIGSAVGSGLAQYAATGDLKKGLLAGLTGYGLGTAMQGAGAAKAGADATAATTQAATEAATKTALTNAANLNITDPTLLNIASTDPTLASQLGAEALNPAGQLAVGQQLAMAQPAIAQAGRTAAEAYTGTGVDALKDTFTGNTIGEGFGNLATGLADPMAYIPAGIGMGGTGIMESQEAFERMLGESEEAYRRRREAMYRNNPEPILYSAGGGIQQFDEGGFVDNLLSGDYGMLGMLNNNPELMFGATGLAAKNNFRGSLLGELYNQYRKRKDAGDEVGAAALQSEIQNEESMQMAAGGSIRGFNGKDDSDTSNELPQIFAPARQAYDVNPNFMAGFNPETMYFNPATIAAPASSLTANSAPPVVEDTYTGTKGGYGGDPLVISPQGQQASIDPFSAYTGEAPAGLVPYSTTLPSLDITGTDLGLPMGEGTPAPAGTTFEGEPVSMPAPEETVGAGFDPTQGGTINIPNIGNINIPAIMNGMGNFDIPESFVPMGGQDFGITQPIIDYQLANTFDLIPEEEIPVVTRKGGGNTLKPIPEGNKGLPNLPVGVRKEMGYMQAGGMTDMQDDPLTKEVTMFILGETDNEQALNEFITKYGSDAFMQLREAVLQSIVPNAQTQGLIRGDGRGGMDDDLRGMIGDKERIAVSQDEFIVPADVVSMLGDGSSDAGSKELYDMMDRVRQEKTGTTKQAPKLANAGGMLPA